MCRWIAYSGSPIHLETLVTKPEHSLLRQSFDTRLNFHTNGDLWSLNADGFGIGWYGDKPEPGLYRDTTPAWNDLNLKNLSAQIQSGLFFAHIRASTGGTVQKTNSHPFKYENWLFQHNGDISHFDLLKQDLFAEISPELFPFIKGTTDTETFFFLALSYGARSNPKEGFEKAIRTVHRVFLDHNIAPVYNFSCAFTNGETIYTFLHAHGVEVKTQFYSNTSECAKDLGDDQLVLPDDSVLVVSEPLNELSGQWELVPNNTFTTIRNGQITLESFMDPS